MLLGSYFADTLLLMSNSVAPWFFSLEALECLLDLLMLMGSNVNLHIVLLYFSFAVLLWRRHGGLFSATIEL